MKLDKIISELDTASGMLLIASMSNKDVRKAMEIIMEVSLELGDMTEINFTESDETTELPQETSEFIIGF